MGIERFFSAGIKDAAEGIVSIASGVKTLITGKLPPDQEAVIMQKMAELETQAMKIAQEDRQSARQREMAVGDKTTRNLGYASLVGFFAVLGAQFWIALAGKTIGVEIQRTIDITTGVLFAWVLAVKDYYFGTSASSAKKNDTISEMMKK